MEVASLKHRPALRGPTPLLRLQGDERLVALTRRGNQSAYEVLVARYEVRLLAFCRHMLSSKEDAEDVLQEVFTAAFNAMVADDRPINVRPWLYRIARNRSLNHLRKQTAIGVDSMDVHLADHGISTADHVHRREEFRQLVGDVQELPETQRTALLLREIDALSYQQIAQAMETSVPAIKSLLVRARVGLAEAAEARALTCEEVRGELGEVAEGLKRKSPPVRRHVRSCDRCAGFEKKLGQTNRALAALFPVGPLLLVKKFLLAQGAGSAAGAASAASGTAAAGAAGTGAAGGALTAGIATFVTKTAAVVAGAAIVTAGAVEVDHSRQRSAPRAAAIAGPAVAPVLTPPRVVATTPQPVADSRAELAPVVRAPASEAGTPDGTAVKDRVVATTPGEKTPTDVAVTSTPGVPAETGATIPADGAIDTGSDVTALPVPAGGKVVARPAPAPVTPAPPIFSPPAPAPTPQPDLQPQPGVRPQPGAQPEPGSQPVPQPGLTQPAAPAPAPQPSADGSGHNATPSAP